MCVCKDVISSYAYQCIHDYLPEATKKLAEGLLPGAQRCLPGVTIGDITGWLVILTLGNIVIYIISYYIYILYYVYCVLYIYYYIIYIVIFIYKYVYHWGYNHICTMVYINDSYGKQKLLLTLGWVLSMHMHTYTIHDMYGYMYI